MIGSVFRPWIKFSKQAHRLKMAYSARRDGICRIFGIALGEARLPDLRRRGLCRLGNYIAVRRMLTVIAPRDPHDIDLEKAFPSLSESEREEMRAFLDDYCAIAFQIFGRLEREHGVVDRRRSDS